MRKLFAILIIILIAFLVAYGLYDPFKGMVNDFAIGFLGPTIAGSIASFGDFIIANVGLGGFAAIALGGGAILGIIIHTLWVKADWSLRRTFQQRTVNDLGISPVTPLPSTPAGATSRPAAAAPVVEEEKQTEAEKT